MPTIKKRPPIEENTINLDPLSVGDATAVIFATVEASSAAFFKAAMKSTMRRKLPRKLPVREFTTKLHKVVTERKGSLYAAIVTSIDSNNVFHPKRFAVAMKRLGLVDEIQAYFNTYGMSEVSERLANAIPWFWADAAVLQLEMVKSEIKVPVVEAICFIGEMSTPDINQLIEQETFGIPVTSGSAGLALDMTNFKPMSSKQIYKSYLRGITQSRSIGLLDKNSSLEAIFESFRQHILSNPSALQKLLPKVKYGGQEFQGRELENLFRNKLVVRKLKMSFFGAYDKHSHSINITRLYNAFKTNRIQDLIATNLRSSSKKRITKEVTSGILASIIGLFFAFTGDTKGQSLPMMNTLKRGVK